MADETPRLEFKQEFITELAGYEPSAQALQTIREIPLVILLGMTGAGRNTIINHLVDTGRYHFIVSDTTRPPKFRSGKMEENGVQYFFRKEADVLDDLRAGKYLEAELIHNQQVSGIAVHELERARESGKIPINEVDVGGTENILRFKPETNFFFIVPPSYDIWMERLVKRENMSDMELGSRVDTAITVIRRALAQDHFKFIINDSSLDSAMLIDNWVGGKDDQGHHQKARLIAEEILAGIIRRRELEGETS